MRAVVHLLILLTFSQLADCKVLTSVGEKCQSILPAIQPFVDHDIFHGNVLVAQKGKRLCEINVGYADVNKNVKHSTNSLFPIASLSKPIMATLVLKLHEKGLLDLHAPILNYLPDFSAPWVESVTLHHLLANRSGLPSHFQLPGWNSGKYKQTLPKEELLSIVDKLELAFPSGTDYLYGNVGWLLIGEVVERVTGKTLNENLNEQVFIPAAMAHSGLVFESNSVFVEGFRWANKGGWQVQSSLNMQVLNAGAGIYSTTGDLLRYLTLLHSNKILSESSLSKLFSDEHPYGWRTEDLILSANLNKQVHSYDGQIKGHSSFVYQVLDDEVSIIILNNTGLGYRHKQALANDILSAYYGVHYPDRQASPSLMLSKSLLNDQWQLGMETAKSIKELTSDNIILVNDLAQQLEWSGHQQKAIDVYAWLVSRLPANEVLQSHLQRLCNQLKEYKTCMPSEKINVGMSILRLEDSTRNAWRSNKPRPITTHVFYPTQDTNVTPLMLGPKHTPLFYAGDVVKNGMPVDGQRPLVLMSHGTGGSALQMLWLADALVKEGYIVAAVNHHGNTAIEAKKMPEGFLLWWERARDLGVVKDLLLFHEQWHSSISASNIAVVGFSLGGYTALSSSGAITDKALFDEYCKHAVDDFSCQPQPEFDTVLEAFNLVENTQQVVSSKARQHENYAISGLKATVAIAPAVVHAFKVNSLESFNIPTLLLVGSEDTIAPSEPNAEYAHSLIPHSELVTIAEGEHYSFLSNCTEYGKSMLSDLCAEAENKDRANIHHEAIQHIVKFLAHHLR